MSTTAWQRRDGSNRRALPSNWPTLRVRILKRDHYQCQLRDTMCVGTASEVDHAGAADDHSDGNLRAVCTPCHATRTKAQAAAGLRAWHARQRRPPEPHPGLRAT